MNVRAQGFNLVEADELEEYPFGPDDRLDSHWFMAWERRRWLNSDMRLKATPECRAYYFDLINISYDSMPIGTLPCDKAVLAKLIFADPQHFESLCKLDYGPLHKWVPCQCGDEVRLMHPQVVRSLLEAVSRREDNRARVEAANSAKRLQRLRHTVSGFHLELGKNDAAIRYMDEWLVERGCVKRTTKWVEQAMGAWNERCFATNRRAQRGAGNAY